MASRWLKELTRTIAFVNSHSQPIVGPGPDEMSTIAERKRWKDFCNHQQRARRSTEQLHKYKKMLQRYQELDNVYPWADVQLQLERETKWDDWVGVLSVRTSKADPAREHEPTGSAMAQK